MSNVFMIVYFPSLPNDIQIKIFKQAIIRENIEGYSSRYKVNKGDITDNYKPEVHFSGCNKK